MKLFCFICIISVACLYVPKSYSFNIAQNICEYVAVDDKGRLRKLLKANRLKLRTVFNDVFCNDNNILIFAAKKNAMEIGQLLIKKLPKGVVEGELENLSTLSPELADIAKARIN
tara:strand:- start:287 stop:631 length:345 start_codon:yes stop_codon:yes gene_type:complete